MPTPPRVLPPSVPPPDAGSPVPGSPDPGTPDPASPDQEVLQKLTAARPRKGSRLLLGALAVLGLGALLAVCANNAGKAAKWETGTVDRGEIVQGVTAVGLLEPTETADVGSDQSGTMAVVHVSENDAVTEGQVLAELDTRSLDLLVAQGEARVGQGEANVRQAEVTAREARKDADKYARMLEQGAASQAEADLASLNAEKAEAALAMTRAQAREARLALDLARHNREEAILRSPLTGIVLTRNVEPGQTVVSALQAATLFEVAADLTRMHLPVEVDEAEVGRVRPGQAATFTVPAWVGRTFEATVEKVHVAPKKGVQVVSYVAELAVRNDDLALRPGMTATTRIVTETLTDVLRVPSEALRYDPEGPTPPSGPHVWIVDGDALSPVPVEVLGNDGSLTAVRAEGLEAGTVLAVKSAGPRTFTPPGSKKGAR